MYVHPRKNREAWRSGGKRTAQPKQDDLVEALLERAAIKWEADGCKEDFTPYAREAIDEARAAGADVPEQVFFALVGMPEE